MFYMNNVLEIRSISLGIEHVCSPSLEAAALCSLIIFKGPSSILIPHTPKLRSADLALLIYTPLNLGEVTEPQFKKKKRKKKGDMAVAAHTTSAWLGLTFPFPSAHSSLSSRCQSICRPSVGNVAAGWQGMLCCPAPLILHPSNRTGFLDGGGGEEGGGCALHGCAVFHLFPPLIREAVSLDPALPLLSLRLASLLSAVTCQQCSGRLCLSLVSMSILITLDLGPHTTTTTAPPPLLPCCCSARPHSNLLWGFLCTGQGGDVAQYSDRQPERDGYRFFL